MLTIGKFAQAGGVGVETIRFYQRKGLLHTPQRAGGIRHYTQQDMQRLQFIRKAQIAGFTLAEIKELLELDAGHDHARARSLAQARITQLDQKIREMMDARMALGELVRRCSHAAQGPCPIVEAFTSNEDHHA